MLYPVMSTSGVSSSQDSVAFELLRWGMKAVTAGTEWERGQVADIGELGGFGSVECGCWGGEREESGMNCGFLAWVTGRMMLSPRKGI